MPAVRNSAQSQSKKLSDGEKFALALGLQDRPDTFKECKKALRPLADETFDLTLPLFQQQTAMKAFVDKAVFAFPGYFGGRHDNYKERVDQLERYASSYLQKSGKVSLGKKKRIVDSDAKVPRPKPKPLYRAKATTPLDVPMPDVPTTLNRAAPATPIPDAAAPRRVTVKKPVFATPTKSRHEVGGATPVTAPGVAPPNPAVPATPTQDVATDVNKAHTVPTKPGQGPTTAVPTRKALDAIARHWFHGSKEQQTTTALPVLTVPQFLRDCNPSMSHCAPAFERAGVTTGGDLEGMAHWKEDGLRNFIKDQHLGCSALEVEAIFIGISALAPHHMFA
ncbi:hypothetical protein B0H16DRAFT_1488108 [Mycena metata]|uniref:Uncharacterized protein n=1 Tax=Mycena metata TaxID=1033252 RepID=A0AAD7KHE4_9AGAR|nr:hypothetical protein B0H16DRAFT_1488108 [Mycena metata]